ncbi:UNVERIFIED_CONTAM: hypothetical protein PYX00_009251 [Menopon gallinae]|uniref:Uncharacterized protein n=1 Tax=Menopon gallinae TaxID=328185 RepID=A0AAW2HAV9_9NEOP
MYTQGLEVAFVYRPQGVESGGRGSAAERWLEAFKPKNYPEETSSSVSVYPYISLTGYGPRILKAQDTRKSTSEKERWLKNDSKALACICLTISSNMLNYVKKASTSKEAWDALREAFESTGPIRKLTLSKELLRMKKTPSTTMAQYINGFSSNNWEKPG